jgi:hypothetical protein
VYWDRDFHCDATNRFVRYSIRIHSAVMPLKQMQKQTFSTVGSLSVMP